MMETLNSSAIYRGIKVTGQPGIGKAAMSLDKFVTIAREENAAGGEVRGKADN
jgi:nucleoside-triphosphatase THEP1